MCGNAGTDWHHRRGRAVKDDHTHCPCNGILVCRRCHNRAHNQPAQARDHGWIVPRHTDAPGSVAALRFDGLMVVLGCDGMIETFP